MTPSAKGPDRQGKTDQSNTKCGNDNEKPQMKSVNDMLCDEIRSKNDSEGEQNEFNHYNRDVLRRRVQHDVVHSIIVAFTIILIGTPSPVLALTFGAGLFLPILPVALLTDHIRDEPRWRQRLAAASRGRFVLLLAAAAIQSGFSFEQWQAGFTQPQPVPSFADLTVTTIVALGLVLVSSIQTSLSLALLASRINDLIRSPLR